MLADTTKARIHGLTMPCVHMNGTGKNGLLTPLQEAHHALNVAYAALKETAPNGRDYYVYGDEGFVREAQGQHESRLRRLDAIAQEIQLIAIHVDSQ